MHRVPKTAAISAAAGSLLLVSAPAVAAPATVEHWTDHVEHIEQVEHAPDWCPEVPFDVLYTEDAHGTFRWVERGPGGFYGGSTFTSDATYTNVETGRTFSVHSQGTDKDLHIVDNGDGTVTIEVLATGPTTLYDDAGNRLFKDVGRTFYTVIIDTAGTPDDPDDDEFVEFLGSDSKGRFDTANRDFCADILTYLG